MAVEQERDEARRENTAMDQRTREVEQQLAVVQERHATSAERRLGAVIGRLGTPGDSA